MKTRRYLALVILVLILLVWQTSSYALPAFPGAEGFGAESVGGRGGRVIPVTNLNDTGAGSLRACVDATGPRICVFRIGGYITVNSRLRIDNPFITIAGQTAPGDGITLRVSPNITSGPLHVRTHDVVLRYFAIRPGINPGQNTGGESDYNIDAITVGERDGSVERFEPFNVIIDHVSMTWTTDEVINTAWRHHDIGIQWSIMAEAIDCDGPSRLKCGGKGPLIGGVEGRDVALHHNLIASNNGRNPMIKNKGGVVDVVNNVIFPSTDISLIADSLYATQSINFIGNYIKGLPTAEVDLLGVRLAPPYNANRTGSYKLYVKGNIGPMRPNDTDPEDWIVNSKSPGDAGFNARTYVDPTEGRIMQSTPLPSPAIGADSAFEAWDMVLAEAGSSRRINAQGELVMARDSVDTRIVNEVESGVSKTIETEPYPTTWPTLQSGTPYADSDSDGMADAWEMKHFGSLSRGAPTTSTADFDNDGYTDLEEFLNGTDPKVAGGEVDGDDGEKQEVAYKLEWDMPQNDDGTPQEQAYFTIYACDKPIADTGTCSGGTMLQHQAMGNVATFSGAYPKTTDEGMLYFRVSAVVVDDAGTPHESDLSNQAELSFGGTTEVGDPNPPRGLRVMPGN